MRARRLLVWVSGGWWRGGVVVGLLVSGLLAPPAEAAGPSTTALAVQVAAPARAVYASDGRTHIEYDLLSTAAFTAPVKLVSLEVRGGGRTLLSLRAKALRAITLPLFGTTPTATIAPSSSVKSLVDVVLPRSFGHRWPRRLTESVRYRISATAPDRPVISSTTARQTIQVSAAPAIRIAPPLWGPGWIDANGCCDDPTAPHRQALVATGDTYQTIETFAIDWIQEDNGRFFAGNGSTLSDYPYYGTPIHAVANGVVVSAITNRPQVVPNTTTAENHTLHDPGDFAGNSVIERIAPHQYATYAHMQTGSVRVKVGQRLRTGQVIGLLGNSGNTTLPHLHFGIVDRPNFFSDSLPFALGSFTLQGQVEGGATPGTVKVAGTPRRVMRAEPLIGDVVNLKP